MNSHERYLQQQLRRSAAVAAHRAMTASHVRDVILDDLDRRAGRRGDWQVEAILKARDSWVFKAITPLAPWALAIKVSSTAVPQRSVARQLEILRHYHDKMASRPGLTVPTPWAAMPEHRTLITEWIDEARLDEGLRRASHHGERQRIIADAARWLRHFHDQGARSVRALNPVELIGPVDAVFGGELAVAKMPIVRSAYRALRQSAGELAGMPIAYVTAHGDFTPHNLFHGPDRTVGFDIAAHQRPLALDVSHFLVSAECDATPRSRRLWSGVEQRDRQDFLAAYGSVPGPIDDRVLALFRLADALRRWLMLLDRMRRSGTKFRRLTKAYDMMRVAQRAATRLGRS